jgi:DNA-3-methyladenine glycosylase II
MTLKVKRYLQVCYPEISDLFEQATTVPKLKKRDIPLQEAVVRVVTGQMLSSQAAQTIYDRITTKAAEQGLFGSWQLDHETLTGCGLSNSKARTICEFYSRVGTDVTTLDQWYKLPPDALLNEIKGYWGMGDWTAGILALFYVGHEDVFPSGDGSLTRAIGLIQQRTSGKRGEAFNAERASPYRSYLALYLWNFLDSGILK